MRFEHVDIKEEKFKKLYHNLTTRYYLHVIAVPLSQHFLKALSGRPQEIHSKEIMIAPYN